jgi:hypothetical protein
MQEIIQEGRRVLFALCQSCYWTASLLGTPESKFAACPVCLEKSVEFLPITRNEIYRFTVTEERGLELHFSLKQYAGG